jgi:hypothetical protein
MMIFLIRRRTGVSVARKHNGLRAQPGSHELRLSRIEACGNNGFRQFSIYIECTSLFIIDMSFSGEGGTV